MTQFGASLKKIAERYSKENINRAVMSAAITINADMSERIFVNGKNSNGSQIGSYNTEGPLYVNPANAPKKFPPKGKEGKTKFSNGKSHKTGYFESYAEYRKKVGRPVDKVNLNLFGILESDFSKGPTVSGNSVVITVNSSNAEKIVSQEKRFGAKIFSLTKQEKIKYRRMVMNTIKGDAK
jgi:hypothetical protein